MRDIGSAPAFTVSSKYILIFLLPLFCFRKDIWSMTSHARSSDLMASAIEHDLPTPA